MATNSPRIRLFAMDVDGTLTDGRITFAADGKELKSFHARDGAGIKLLRGLGIEPMICSGRASDATTRRATELGITRIEQAVSNKAAQLRAACSELNIDPTEAAFIGDDLSDIPAMRIAGWSAAPADAASEARAAATHVCDLAGGHGAVRDAIEALLEQQGLWADVLAAHGVAPAQDEGVAPAQVGK